MRLTKIAVTALFLTLCVVISGCPRPIKVAYETAVGSKAFLDTVKRDHPECDNPATTTQLCTNYHRAVAAKDLLIDAGETYCGGAGFETGKVACNPPAKGTPALQIATDKLNSAVTVYKQAEKDLRAITQ